MNEGRQESWEKGYECVGKATKHTATAFLYQY